jgi:hypothetical protein
MKLTPKNQTAIELVTIDEHLAIALKFESGISV